MIGHVPAKVVENEKVAGGNEKTFQELEAGILFIAILIEFFFITASKFHLCGSAV